MKLENACIEGVAERSHKIFRSRPRTPQLSATVVTPKNELHWLLISVSHAS